MINCRLLCRGRCIAESDIMELRGEDASKNSKQECEALPRIPVIRKVMRGVLASHAYYIAFSDQHARRAARAAAAAMPPIENVSPLSQTPPPPLHSSNYHQ